MGFLRRTDQSPIPPADSWTVAEGEHAGRPLVLRFNEGAGATDRGGWPLRVGIAIPFIDATAEGLPGEADGAALTAIEDAALAAAAGGNAVAAFAVTTGGMRELVFYARNEAAADALVSAARSATERHDVQHYYAPDKRWEAYEEFRP